MPVVIIPAYKPDKTFVTITDQICAVLKHLENRGKGVAIKNALRYYVNDLCKGKNPHWGGTGSYDLPG